MAYREVLVDAHRGAAVSFPENTLIAFEAAVSAGSDSIEFDVQLSSDGLPVVIHDETVDRTTNGTGEVSALTLVQLRDLDAGSWKADSFAGEKIPTLDETLSLLRRMVRINMELKSEDPRLADLAIDAVGSLPNHGTVIAASFHLGHLRRVKERLPRIRTSLILDREVPDGFWETEGAAVDSVAIHRDHVTAEIVDEMRRRNRSVSVWTVDDPERAIQIAAMGVEAITTNDPLTILEVLGEAGYRGPPAPVGG